MSHHATDWRADLRDAIAPRTFLLVVGVFLVQLAFVASYVGAFHHPEPHDIRLGVVAPTAQSAGQLRDQLDTLPGHPLDPVVVSSRDRAVADLRTADLRAVLVVDANGTVDELVTAGGGGTSLVTAVESVLGQVEQRQGRTLTTTDVVPLQSGDARGLTGFYLTIGWLVGGYLVASLLGVARGARPANVRRAVIRLTSLALYAVASGIGGALIVGPWLGALTGHFWALAGLGTLLVLSAGAVTMALQGLFGTLGIGLTVLLFVVLGNPSAGGAYQSELLPSFWRTIGGALPNGAGTSAVRDIVYFGSHGVAPKIWLTVAYVVVGAVITLLASWRRPAPVAAS